MTDAEKLAQFPESPIMITLGLINSKWKVVILWVLLGGKLRFGELRRKLGISQKVLTQQLRELEADGLVLRTTFPEVPPRVEYQLSPLGETLRPVGRALWDWGLSYKLEMEKAPQADACQKSEEEAE